MDSTSIITTAISKLDAEIERLTEAREDLVALVQEHEIVDAPKSRRSTRKSTKAPKATTRKASTKKATKQTSSEPTRREIIMDLLDEGVSVADIADELDIKPNYVYHVKRDWKELVA
ncbi:MAG TPA: winged helix-turn-helix domain-containing protein [Scandinavium sp.]|jgi:DNA-binding NarL/FixJ family response regulator|uniref:winged helix-turn-helix domain-containing protein n=1 Tax=Scandinavium sp. TaxID=2830653 RepID=UPI002E36E652|nr:winged helix-turn-helix domain-containing protein [Scandinavium sp.]HEX4500649.1 winged helix-turn-helix domain-containing protein [Scandinavium sp.]